MKTRAQAGWTEGRTSWGRSAGLSLAGMALGWPVIQAVVAGVMVTVDVIDGKVGRTGGLMFLGCFAVASLMFCAAAWLVIAWPVTACCWRSMVEAGEAWWHHAVRGGAAGLCVGLIVPLATVHKLERLELWFVGLAVLVGTVAGGWVGWRLQRQRLWMESLERMGWR